MVSLVLHAFAASGSGCAGRPRFPAAAHTNTEYSIHQIDALRNEKHPPAALRRALGRPRRAGRTVRFSFPADGLLRVRFFAECGFKIQNILSYYYNLYFQFCCIIPQRAARPCSGNACWVQNGQPLSAAAGTVTAVLVLRIPVC